MEKIVNPETANSNLRNKSEELKEKDKSDSEKTMERDEQETAGNSTRNNGHSSKQIKGSLNVAEIRADSSSQSAESTKSALEKAADISSSAEFKKPILIGRIGKLPRKVDKTSQDDVNATTQKTPLSETHTSDTTEKLTSAQMKAAMKNLSPAELLKEQSIPLPYREPKWSGLPSEGSNYRFEVLKSGTIIETINVSEKPFHVLGRLSGCDIIMAHPTISRYHAIIQYKAHETEDKRPLGLYIYDLNSSHGTFVNKNRINPNQYVRLHVGHVVKLGCSTRLFILHGPSTDREEESEHTLTELKQMKMAKKQEAQLALLKAKQQKELEEQEKEKKLEEEGINWGMADDADEETDLTENPYAQPANEELYLDDPKKTLRGYYEREGYTLEYDCQERGIGQFVCRVELPVEDARGRPVVAEVIHKGKKKDAVIQCALEACRILDRQGLLRQAKHESRKRKSKNWKEDDFYDSDDDTFLDRTGNIEKKREKRMKEYDNPTSNAHSDAKQKSGKAVTYDELMEKSKELKLQITIYEKKLSSLRDQGKKLSEENSGDVDALDQFMTNLGKQDMSISTKAEISKTKMEINKLKIELGQTEKLAEIAKPAYLPELIKKNVDHNEVAQRSSVIKRTDNSIFIGKKIVKPIKKNIKHPENIVIQQNDDFQAESESDEEVEMDESTKKTNVEKKNVEMQNMKNISNPNERIRMKSSDVPEIENTNKGTGKRKTAAMRKMFGPMRPPANYVIPEDYYNQGSDRDLPEITEPEN